MQILRFKSLNTFCLLVLLSVYAVCVQAAPDNAAKNCRAMLTLHEPELRSGEYIIWVYIKENPDFNATLGDACEGDLRNLWPDLKRYDAELKTEKPYKLRFHNVAVNLDLFPKTHLEIAEYIDDAAKQNADWIRPKSYNRAKLEDALALRKIYLNLIRTETHNYFATQHAPILNDILAEYHLGMGQYNAGEKFGFCNVPLNNCNHFLLTDKDKEILLKSDRNWTILYTRPMVDYWPTLKLNTP